jgi:hypothetical protein
MLAAWGDVYVARQQSGVPNSNGMSCYKGLGVDFRISDFFQAALSELGRSLCGLVESNEVFL